MDYLRLRIVNRRGLAGRVHRLLLLTWREVASLELKRWSETVGSNRVGALEVDHRYDMNIGQGCSVRSPWTIVYLLST